jgi:hypothetical protein
MSRLDIPGKVGGTGELREIMLALAPELRLAAGQVNAIRKQIEPAVRDALVASGAPRSVANNLAEELAHDLRALDTILHTTASYADDVANRTHEIARAADKYDAQRAAVAAVTA